MNGSYRWTSSWFDKKEGNLPPQDVGAADVTEGPEEESGSRSNKELETETEALNPSYFVEGNILLRLLL